MCGEQIESQFWRGNNYAGLYTKEKQKMVDCVKLFLFFVFSFFSS